MGYVTGKTIKELRERRKLTQKELSEKIGVSDKTVSKWETGLSQSDMRSLISADCSVKQAGVQNSMAKDLEGRARILETEIRLEKAPAHSADGE